jgi:hypothetical protein
MNWIVIVGSGAWAKCYGVFASYEAAIEWARINQFDRANVHAYPITNPARG